MSAVTIFVVGGLFLLAFLAIAGIMVWQESQEHRLPAAPIYVIEDAIAVAWDQLDDGVRARLKKAGVRRIIEWEVFFLQGLADKKAARRGVTVVAGGDDAAVHYVAGQLEARGFAYDLDDIRAVLAGEAHYLASIGAVGAVAEEEV